MKSKLKILSLLLFSINFSLNAQTFKEIDLEEIHIDSEADTLLLITKNSKEKLAPGSYRTHMNKGSELEFYINEQGNADRELKSVYKGMVTRHYYLNNGRIKSFMEREPDAPHSTDSTYFQRTEIPLYDSNSGKWKFQPKLCKVRQTIFKGNLADKSIYYENHHVKAERYEEGKLIKESWLEYADDKEYENGKLAFREKYNWDTKEYEKTVFDNTGKITSQVREYEHGKTQNTNATITLGELNEESLKKSYIIYTEFHSNGKPKTEKRKQAGIVTIKHFSTAGKLLKTEKVNDGILPTISAPSSMN